MPHVSDLPFGKIAIVGAYGQLGTELRTRLGPRALPLGRGDLDLAEPARVAEVLEAAAPDAVVNAAAYNLVDKAETEPDPAWQVNALGPRALAKYCAARRIPLLHVSTDYVFGLDRARRAPYQESDPPGPLGAYGVSKLAGEYFVRSTCPRHFVVRTCGLYGTPPGGGKGNFILTMLRLGRERGVVRVVDDQWCTPTSAADLAEAVLGLLGTDRYGVYHATNSGATTWCRLAQEVFRAAGLQVEVHPITTEAYGAPAPRPAYSVLDGSRLAEVLGHPLRSWEAAVAEYVGRMG